MRRIFSLALGAAAALSGASAVRAASVVYTAGGFDNTSRFSTAYVNTLDPTLVGDLRGQDAAANPGHAIWLEAQNANPANVANTTGTPTGVTNSTAIIQTAVFNTSPQAVQVNYRGTDNRWAPTVSITPDLTNPNVLVTWNERFTTDAATFGPFFGIEGYDRTGQIHRLGGLGVDATTDQIIYFNAHDTASGGIEVGPTITPNVFHSFATLYNYSTQTYSVTVDNTQIATGVPFENSSAVFTDADIASLNIGGNSAVPGVAYFDDYVVSSVPEPTTLALAGIAIGGAILRRPKRATR